MERLTAGKYARPFPLRILVKAFPRPRPFLKMSNSPVTGAENAELQVESYKSFCIYSFITFITKGIIYQGILQTLIRQRAGTEF